jgi:hypothetical protein
MAYMKDASGRRLDTFTVADEKAPVRRRKETNILGRDKPLVKRVVDGRCGDGSDNDFITNTTTTITKDSFFRDMRVGQAGVVTVSRGVTIHVSGECEINGILQWAYTDGQNSTGSTGGLGGGIPSIGSGSLYAIGGASGQAGQNGVIGVGANGVQAATKLTHGGIGGNGGNGGASGATSGGTGAIALAKTTPVAGLRTISQFMAVAAASALSTGQGGNSGGAGAGDGTNSGGASGPGGSAGGMGALIANLLAGSGIIRCPGGNGGNGGNGTAGNAAGGGGGGGGGGGILGIWAHDTSKWTGVAGAPGGIGGTGGSGSGTGVAGSNGTNGASGVAFIASLNAFRSADTSDTVPVLTYTGENLPPLQTVVKTLGNIPARFRTGGPMEQYTTGGTTYLKGGLYSPNSGYLGKNNGGAPYIMDYYGDGPVHSIGMLRGSGKFRLKVDGEWVNDFSTVTYSGTGGIDWLQVSFSKRRQMRHFEWHLSGVPVRGLAHDATDTFFASTEPLDIPRAFIGDSFSEGASGNLNSNTWEMGSLVYVVARILGYDNFTVDAQGGTGFTNNGGASDGKKTITQRILDDFGPLKGTPAEPKHIVIVNGFNDGDATTLQAAATTAFANCLTVAPKAVIDYVYNTNTGSPAAGYLSGRTKIKNAALAAPNVRSFIDAIDGTITVGPAAKVTVNPFVASPFLTGTGYQGATNGTGNTDYFVSTDGIHPSYPAGHEYWGRRIASLIKLVEQV